MSREEIIASIEKNKPLLVPMETPDYRKFNDEIDQVLSFTKQVNAAGGNVIECERKDIEMVLSDTFQNAGEVCSMIDEFRPGNNRKTDEAPASYENLDLVVVNGQFGVAENGAVWVSDQNLLQRILPFITRDLVLVIQRESLVDNMHNAYTRIGDFSEGFGVFISGPSKTADIEQALVIGAQGPMSMTVLLVAR